jgi:MFS family permease
LNQTTKKTIWTRGFVCIIISNICANMAMFAVSTYLTTYMAYLGVGAGLAGLIAGLYYTTGLLMRPIAGPMQATLNKKKLMTATYALGFLVNLCYAMFPTVGLFVAFRLIHGIQLAFYGSMSMTIASSSLPEEKMSSGLGVFGLSGIVSQALGPGISSFVRGVGETLAGPAGGFRAIFLTSALFSLISVIPCFFLPETDTPGAKAEEKTVWYKNIIAGEALMPSFVIGLFTVAGILYSTYMIPYGAYRGIENVGLYFTVNAVLMVVSRPIAGKLTDTYGQNVTFYPGMALYMASFIIISCATSITHIVLGAACASIGAGVVHPAVQSMALQSVKPRRRAVASNTVFTVMDLGNFLGPTLGGAVLSAGSYESMFRFALIPLALAVVLFAVGWKPYLRNRAKAMEE